MGKDSDLSLVATILNILTNTCPALFEHLVRKKSNEESQERIETQVRRSGDEEVFQYDSTACEMEVDTSWPSDLQKEPSVRQFLEV